MNSQQNKNTSLFNYVNKWYKISVLKIYIRVTSDNIYYFKIINPIGFIYNNYYKYKYRNNMKILDEIYLEIQQLRLKSITYYNNNV